MITLGFPNVGCVSGIPLTLQLCSAFSIACPSI